MPKYAAYEINAPSGAFFVAGTFSEVDSKVLGTCGRGWSRSMTQVYKNQRLSGMIINLLGVDIKEP